MKTNADLRRILYVSWSVLPPRMANAVQVVRMANALVRTQEVEVVLLARRGRGDHRAVGDVASQSGLDSRVQLVLLPSNKIAAGLEIMRLATQDLSGKPFDCVYSRVLPIFLRRLSARQRILEIHEPPRANWPLKSVVFDRAVASGSITGIVYISERLERIVEREHAGPLAIGKPRRLVLHSGGASPVSPVLPPGKGPFTIAYAGRLDKLDRAVVESLAEMHPDIVLNVYGNPGTAPRWLADCPIVRLCGWIDASEIIQRLAEAHALIAPYPDIPSTAWFSPVKIFDYAAAGRPILVSDCEAIRDVFPDGEIGWIIPSGDQGAWASAIKRLRIDTRICLEMSTKALEFASRHDFPARARSVLDLIV